MATNDEMEAQRKADYFALIDKFIYVSDSESEDEDTNTVRNFLRNSTLYQSRTSSQKPSVLPSSKPGVLQIIRTPDIPVKKVLEFVRSASAPVSSTKNSTVIKETPIHLLRQSFSVAQNNTTPDEDSFMRDLESLRSSPAEKKKKKGAKKLAEEEAEDISEESAKMPAKKAIALGKRKREVLAPVVARKNGMFSGMTFYYFPNSDVCGARRMRMKKAEDNGATRATEYGPNVTHIIVDNAIKTYKEVARCLKFSSRPEDTIIVNQDFLVHCFREKKVVDHKRKVFLVPEDAKSEESEAPPGPSSTAQLHPPDDSTCQSAEKPKKGELTIDEAIQQVFELGPFAPEEGDDEVEVEVEVNYNSDDERPVPKAKETRKRKYSSDASWQKNWACMRGGDGSSSAGNPNAYIIEILGEMAIHYGKINEIWRTRSYRKAVSILKRQTKKIETAEHAKLLPDIGISLSDKIQEIVRNGHLRRLDMIKSDPAHAALEKFMNIYGVGYTIAFEWVRRGYTTFEQLLEKAHLTSNQSLGIERYDDLLTRIPREEITALGKIIKDTAKEIDSDVNIIIGGSYRRGAKDSGDIDLIVTKPGATAMDLNPFLHKLTSTLEDKNFLVNHLAVSRSESGSKWHGCCVLPGKENPIWRRIDFLLVPDAELGAALIYFTGNDIFNRSIRLLASRKQMRLNQRGLYKNVLRGDQREKLTEGELVEGRDERKIFEILGVPWREPEDRIC